MTRHARSAVPRPAPRARTLAAAAAAAAALAGGGDNLPAPPGGAAPDAGGPRSRAVVVSGTFVPGEAGVMSALYLEPAPFSVDERVAPTGAVAEDPVLRHAGDELLVVNRAGGNNVTILDAATYAVKAQLSTGAGSNPQDVAVAGGKLFVPAFGTAGVVVVTRDSGERATIDLSALDPDGEPNCVSAYAVGDEIYVACELLDPAFTPRGPGKIAVLDAATGAVKTTFELANANPFGVFEQAPAGVLGGDLVIPTVPSFGDLSAGCVERVATGAAPHANGCVVGNAELGGYAARVAFQILGDTPIQWMIVSSFDTEPRGNLQGYDLSSELLWRDPISPPSQLLVDLVTCPDDLLVVADQTMAGHGLRVYESTVELTSAPLPVGLRPSSAHGLACYR